MDCSPPGASVHEDSPGKSTEVGCHALLRGIFPVTSCLPQISVVECNALVFMTDTVYALFFFPLNYSFICI